MIGITKKSSLTNLISHNSKQLSLADQSFADSTISKRFSRKKNNTTQSNKHLNHTQSYLLNIQKPQISKQKRIKQQQHNEALQVEDFFIKIVHNRQQRKDLYVAVSSERTQSTDLRDQHLAAQPSIDTIEQLKEQLLNKGGQIMCLQDQNMKMKRDLLDRQQEYLKSNIKRQRQYENERSKLKQQSKLLSIQLSQKNNQIQVFRNTSFELSREIKILKMDKIMLQKQLEEAYRKKLTKELKELMSYRQISIKKELEQMKQKMYQNKTQYQLTLEAQIQKLKQDNDAKMSQIKNLQIHNRILNRKMDEYQKSLKDNIQQFNKSYNCLKEELKVIRKENMKLRRLHLLNIPHSIKKITIYESSQQSLSLSLSSDY